MQEHVTLLQPEQPAPGSAGMSSALPPDLLEQVRGRVRLLAALLLAGFAFDPLIFLLTWTVSRLTGTPLPPEISNDVPFLQADAVVAVASAVVWWVARREWVSPSRLLNVGLLYQVVICLELGITMPWQYYLNEGSIPPLTWAPTVIILFPLLMPGPPRRMLAAAITAGATGPLALMLLDLAGKAPMDADDYVRSVAASVIAVVFAYLGARVLYRLGREVSAARELGSYRLEERLGVGGMGEVWRARHRMLARPAAIKLIRPSTPGNGAGRSGEMMRRFEREAQVIAGLRSPHTVDLFDFGVAENGAFYYVMELLEGLDADALVRRFGPVPPERVVYLLAQACHSLSEAESCGLVHRDIKPANIFLCRYGEDCDFVKVLDFGLVKAFGEPTDGDRPEGPALTRDDRVQGTPAFIAPEQALGEPDLDARVDIYALGCVAYWLLTGEFVFTADTTMGYLVHHIHTPPRPPSQIATTPVPRALDDVVLACLAKDRAQRPQSAKELSRRLAAVEGSGRWSAAAARTWWDAHLPVSARHPA
jgi:eukaryotic-like serine/threonine-protein kinase